MSRLRTAVVGGSLAAVGLGAGIALGVGPLDEVDTVRPASQTDTKDKPAPDTDPVESAFVGEAGTKLVAGTLEGRSALVVTLPGAAKGDTDRLADALRAAGATFAGSIGFTERLLDPAERQYAESVAEEAAKDVKDVPASDEVYTRVGAVLARAYAGTGAADAPASTIRTVITTAGLVDQVQEPETRADLVILVGGPQRDADESGRAEVLGGLLEAWDTAAKGVVLAAPEAAGFDGGLLHELRRAGKAEGVSTFDGLDATAGAYVTVEVAAGELEGRTGSYGTGDDASAVRP
ncbi:copper transporter [Aeromicrobium massiliense]|uniref:copper transporter n=1 Tax=Aeromicrobium massiliense TaxID=1464554 RepID=UPI0005782103|nr:copper transporter [Aeromicrobium massiliense]